MFVYSKLQVFLNQPNVMVKKLNSTIVQKLFSDFVLRSMNAMQGCTNSLVRTKHCTLYIMVNHHFDFSDVSVVLFESNDNDDELNIELNKLFARYCICMAKNCMNVYIQDSCMASHCFQQNLVSSGIQRSN